MAFDLSYFDVRLDDYPDEREWYKSQGWDYVDAAVNFVSKWNAEAGIYPRDGDSVDVIVKDSDGKEHRVRVYAQRIVDYYGIECKYCTWCV